MVAREQCRRRGGQATALDPKQLPTLQAVAFKTDCSFRAFRDAAPES